MLRILLVLIPLGLSCLAGCSASKSRAKSAPHGPDTTGTFVDACRVITDSVKVETDRIFTYEGGYATEYAVKERSGDTVFFAEALMAFIRRKALPPAVGHEYFYGYNHRGNRKSWAGAMFVQVRPSKEVAEGWEYVPGRNGPMFTCTPGGPGKKTGVGMAVVPTKTVRDVKDVPAVKPVESRPSDSDPADHTDYNFPPDLTLLDLGAAAGLNARYKDIEIEWREIPELELLMEIENLEGKLRGVTKADRVRVKDFYAIGLESGLMYIMLNGSHLDHMRLTHPQLRDLGARLKIGAGKENR